MQTIVHIHGSTWSSRLVVLSSESGVYMESLAVESLAVESLVVEMSVVEM
jgi:hypothetical protein